MSESKNLLALLQRPLEPTFLPKDDGKTVIDVPDDYLTDRYKPIGLDISNRFGGEADTHIPIRNVGTPDINFALKIERRGAFSLFVKQHREIAGKLIDLFLHQPDLASLMAVATYARDRINAVLFQYALSVAIQNRPDTTDLNIPSIIQLFPDQFVDPSVFPKMREEGAVVTQANRTTIDILPNFTASEREEEQRMGYFREDIGVNMHHWHWHLVYPGDAGPGNNHIVRKDRRGELFYYMHNQLIARYNCDRFCNRLATVKRLSNLREPIPEAYFPKMIRSSNNRAYPPRTFNTILRDVNRIDNDTIVEVGDLERWRDRIYEAIDQGFVLDTIGLRIPLDETRGIDLLGDIVESSVLTPNEQLYGSLHNMGHNVISYSHDPDYRYLEDYGVMGDVTTAMRDPIFYRWHAFIDGVFARHKDRLNPYNTAQLSNPGITVTAFNTQLNRPKAPPNVLLTYWQRSSVDLAAGLDFGPEGNVFASFTHLQHAPFSWRITVNNTGEARRATGRIFLGPKSDERGTTLTYAEQRRFMIEMDKFSINLTPGINNITRRDDQSSVTIPYERTFRAIGTSTLTGSELDRFRFCGCGWPSHMLVPKGSPEGVQFVAFVMFSNFNDDNVNQDFDENVDCNDSHSFCGLRDKLYPDKRGMGFPFDRKSQGTVQTLQEFVAPNTNMRTTDVQVRFTNTVIAKT